MKQLAAPSILFALILFATMTFISPLANADRAETKRQKILDMRTEVLERVYREKPSTKAEVQKADGYAVFSAGGGQGVVHNNDSGDKGKEASLATTVVNRVSLYQLTENGLALQATLQGTKYWKSKKLN
jgi:hypothetical protein